jgi:HlyD family secretion protein
MRTRIQSIRNGIRERFATLTAEGKTRPPRRLIGGLVLLGVLIVAAIYLARTANANGSLASTGAVEAIEIRLAAEIGGKVSEVLVDEGDHVEAGQPLLRLDDAQLQNQRDQAEAGLAQANAGVAAAGLELERAQQEYDALFEGVDLATAMALQELAAARDAVDDAERRVINLESPGKDTDIDSARATVTLAGDILEKAQDDYEPYANKAETNLVRANLLLRLSAAQQSYDDAVRRLNNLEGSANSIDMGVAEAGLEVAQARLALAEDDYAALDGGPDPDMLALADGHLRLAQAQVAAAAANVLAAEAALASADLQLAKAEILAPANGTILYRNIQPGEFVAPGATLLVLAQLDQLTITVYLPEDRYGEVNLGDEAEIEIDSFPGEAFSGSIVRIADEAEFTPRNVQTGEGRRTTVFAIELRLDDSSGRLKPGMPADVYFSR